MKSGNLFAELKRRNVYKVAVAYAVASWLIARAADSEVARSDVRSASQRSTLPKTLRGEGEVKVDKRLTENQLSGNMAK
jgi:hypothetical protein